LPPIDELQKLFYYDYGKDCLCWAVSRLRSGSSRNAIVGEPVVGTLNSNGHMQLAFNNSRYLLHRVVWAVAKSEDPYPFDIDHVNRVRTDNRIKNLRLDITGSGNGYNSVSRGRPNSTGLRGVRRTRSGRFEAIISWKGNKQYLGLYDTAEQAHAAYCEAAAFYAGEFMEVKQLGCAQG
jgi:hypothetical protein